MRNYLYQQVEKIIDEGEGDHLSVIVHMGSADSDPDPVLEVIAQALGRRAFLLTARAVAPRGEGREHDNGHGAFESDGLLAQLGSLAKVALSVADIREAGLRNLEPLLASDIVKRYIEHAQQSHGENFNPESIAFWPGSAAFLKLTADDLHAIPEAVPGVIGIYPNRTIPPPSFIEDQRVTREVSEGRPHGWGVEKINALAAWGAHGVRGRGVTVGMLDTGVDFSHVDLEGKLKIDGWAEFDAEGSQVVGSLPHDSGSHGTICAGAIVGGNHSGGWIGVAPEAQLAVALVIDGDKGGTEKQALAGLMWMLNQKVDVINMSIGRLIADPETSPVFAETIYKCVLAGIPSIVAIGNEGAQTTDSPGNDLLAYGVGATDLHDNPAGFSGGRTQLLRDPQIPFPPKLLPFPYKKPEIAAPGVAIKTSLPRDEAGKDRWGFGSGTSLATAQVSGAVALLLSATTIREYTQAAVRTYAIQDSLSCSVEELGESGHDQRFGWGRVDVLRAINFAHEAGFKPPA